MREALLSPCRLCPRRCGADRLRGQAGYCKSGREIKIARAALHHWEEPPISGENGSGAVFFSYCTMQCVFCQNYAISTLHRGKQVSVEELADAFLALQEQHAENINLVTPTHYVPQIIDALDIARKGGLRLPVVYNTSGYELPETLRLLEGYVDIYLPDFKYWADRYAVRYSNAPRYAEYAKAALAEMYRQTGPPVFDSRGVMRKGVIVRHMLLPGLLFDAKKILDYLYKTYKHNIYISIMNQYTPLEHVRAYPEINRPVSAAYYGALLDYASKIGIERAFIQEGGTVSESFIPAFYPED